MFESRVPFYGGCNYFCHRCGALEEIRRYPPTETENSAERAGLLEVERFAHDCPVEVGTV